MEKEFFPWDDIPDMDVVPSGDYYVRGEVLEDGESSTGKRMFSAQMIVEEPQLYAGMSLFENFVTGTDEDPKGIVPGAFGTRRLKKMLKAAQVAQSNNTQQLCQNFKGTLFGVSVAEYTEESGEYAGMQRNRITAYWKRGEREPGVAEGQAGGKGKGPAAAASAAAAAAKAQAPAAPSPPATGTPSPSPAASTKPVAAPQAPAAPAAAAPSTGQVAVGTESTVASPAILCPMCGKNVPATEFAQHVQACAMQHGEK